MYKKNEEHLKKRLYDFTYKMPDKVKIKFMSSWAKTFYEEVFVKIDEDKFSNMYSKNDSRPNFPVNILLSLEIIKGIFNLTDSELLGNFHFNLEYMYAVGLREIGELYLGERTLYDFRKRLLNYNEKTGVDHIEEIFCSLATEFIKVAKVDTDIQRMDSTMIEAHIKHMSRYELLTKVIYNFLKKLDDEEKKKLPKGINELENKEERKNLYEEANQNKQKKVLTKLAGKLLDLKNRFKNNTRINQSVEYKNIEKVLKDQTIIDENSKEIIVKESQAISPKSLQNPIDTDATYRKKAGKSHKGYVANITETCSKKNKVQMITKCSIEENVVSDKELYLKDIEESKAKTMVADGAYNTKETREKSTELGINLVCTNLTGRKVNEETNLLLFEIDEEKGILKCPNGCVPEETKIIEKSTTYVAWFEKKNCEECSQKEKCIMREQKKSNVVRVTKSKIKNAKFVEEIKTDKFQELKNLRPAIEGTISGLKRGHGLGDVLTYTKIRVSYFVMFKIIGCNFKRLKRAIEITFFNYLYDESWCELYIEQ